MPRRGVSYVALDQQVRALGAHLADKPLSAVRDSRRSYRESRIDAPESCDRGRFREGEIPTH